MTRSKGLLFETALRDMTTKTLTSSKSKHELLTEFFLHTDVSEWSMANNDRSVGLHRIFQYPAMMVPEVQQKIVRVFKTINPGIKNLVDPFMGGGTALTAALYNGLDCHGQDINPLSVLVSKVKTARYNATVLRQHKAFIDSRYRNSRRSKITVDFPGRDRWFEKNVSQDLSKLREIIKTIAQIKYRQFFWVLIAETIRLSSNDRTSTYKLHRRETDEIRQRSETVNVYEIFNTLYHQVMNDIEEHAKILDIVATAKVSIKLLDSTKKIPTIKGTKYDLVVTSPPYGDNKTTVPYGQHSYLPLQWIPLSDIDEKADKSFLESTGRIDTISLGGKGAILESDRAQALLTKSKALKRTVAKLTNDPRRRYAKIINFFSDFDSVLSQLHAVTNRNSYQVIIMGNRTVGSITVPNNTIVAELLEANNFTFITEFNRKIHNKRMPRKNDRNKTMNSEQIVVSTKVN